jgi:hypothetical protein
VTTPRADVAWCLRRCFISALVAAAVVLLCAQETFAQASNLTAAVSGSTVTFRWDGPGSLWVLEAGTAPGLSNVGVLPFSSTTRIQIFRNVPSGTYYVRVRDIVGGVPGPPSNEVVAVVGCAWRELDLRSVISGFQVQLTWTMFGGETHTGLQLEAGTAPGLANIAVLTLPPFAPNFTAAAPPGTYYVRVRSIGLCGAGPPSNEVRLNIGGTNCVPQLSGSRTVTASGIYTVTVTLPSGCMWNAFTREGGWLTVLTTSGVGSGTIQYRVTLPGGGTGQIYVTTASGRYFVNITS